MGGNFTLRAVLHQESLVLPMRLVRYNPLMHNLPLIRVQYWWLSFAENLAHCTQVGNRTRSYVWTPASFFGAISHSGAQNR